MGVAYHLTTVDGLSSVTASYWAENLHLSSGVLKEHRNLNGTE